MAQYLPLYRTSFGSLEDDRFFSACSSQPVSRLMSVFTSQEQDQLAEDTNSAAQLSEPMASVCLPLIESTPPSASKQSPAPEPRADSHDNRRQSSYSKVEEPATETDAACQDRLPFITRAQLDSHISKQEIDNILRNIRGYLSARQHRDSNRKLPMLAATKDNIQIPSDSPHPETQKPALSENQYIVTTDDIIGILGIVISCVRKFQDDDIQPGCQSLLFPNSTRVKPTLDAQNITLSASTVADPATTIYLPRPCFSWADSPEVFRYPSPKTVTTYVSRQNDIHDDDSGDIPGIESPGPSMYSPQYNSQNRHLSWPQSSSIAQRASFDNDPSFHNFGRSEKVSRHLKQRSTSEPQSPRRPRNGLIRATTTPITSFPRLISRSCTNDWLTPLGLSNEIENEEAQHQETTTDLYNRGIDAHSGVCLYNPLPILEESPQPTPTFLNCPSFADDSHSLGRSIGVASHRRIKEREPCDQSQSLKENILDGLRRYSFLPLLDQTPENIRQDHLAHPSCMEFPLEGDEGRKLSSQELLQQILHQSDKHSMRSSGSKSSSGALNTIQPKESCGKQSEIEVKCCSEDTTPHICLDAQWGNESFC
ncbi:hypothetical protein F4803DRAFT_569818 [Xylaria telfairii]|nr:hypothetical protein F4803DRAFT_569818 [Xylaria telfairii]